MKSKAELLENKKNKKKEEFQNYVTVLGKAIKENYPNGLDFDECPHIEQFLCYRDVDINYYTRLEETLIKAIEETEEFKEIAKELIKNGYSYEFSSHVSHPRSEAEWRINLIIQ